MDKILSEFCLTEDSKAALQHVMDEQFVHLLLGTETEQRASMEAIKQEILETFPHESIEELKKVIAGTSEVAILIKNCPERTGFEQKGAQRFTELTYSEYIGTALYEICGAKHTTTAQLERRTAENRDQDTIRSTSRLHRDRLTFDGNKRSQYIIFSCPHNAEHALTEVVHLQKALEAIPPEDRKKLYVLRNTQTPDFQKYSSLEGLLKVLSPPELDPLLERITFEGEKLEGGKFWGLYT